MGKNLRGKACRRGNSQRKDGMYTARFTGRDGSRREKHFKNLPEARNWLADARYENKHGKINNNADMTVDMWFQYWMENLICDLATNTKRNYQERYKHSIQTVIGTMRISDVKPMHCKVVLNRMDATYAGSTIRQTYITMGTMLRSAVMNDSSIKTTMDRYVHVTDDSLANAVRQFQSAATGS